MRQVLRGATYVLGGLAGLALAAILVLYAGSEVMLRLPQTKGPVHLVASTDPDAVARGAHIAKVYGCNNCHGDGLRGRLFFDQMPVAKITAPNLTLAAARQSDSDLARAIRQGVAADGRALWIMPSDAFAHLTDAETADVIAYVRGVPRGGARQAPNVMGPVGRLGMLVGKFRSAPQLIRADGGRELPDFGPRLAQGRRLARACMECHGTDLKGTPTVNSPDLTIAAAYDEADFERLLRTGVAAGDRRLGLMSEVAPLRFNDWTHEEIAALHAYLQARAAAS